MIDDFDSDVDESVSVEAFTEAAMLNYAMYVIHDRALPHICLLYTSPSPRDRQKSRMPSSA